MEVSALKRLRGRDLVATTAVLFVLLPYIAYLNRTPDAFSQDPGPMTVWAFIGLFVSIGAWGLPVRTALGRLIVAGFFGSILLGVLALFTGTTGNLFLALFVAGLVALWVAETVFASDVVPQPH
jgi:hypothetical protein